MKLNDFNFILPPELIAQFPTEQRTSSRLLVLNRSHEQFNCEHHFFHDLPQYIRPGDLLVFNDTRVMPARFYGVKASGGRVEILIERLLNSSEALAHIRASKSPRSGMRIALNDKMVLEVIGRQDDLYQISCGERWSWSEIMQAVGHIPLPPYIERADQQTDIERYQTVYAKQLGAVAAPTAGLHFDEALLEVLQQKGVDSAFVTLHVGSGTFQPVRVENIADHRMHSEYVEVDTGVCQKIATTKANGGRVIAVGTTAVRCLETAAQNGQLQPFKGETNIFIYPGYRFNVTDGLITNFHTPMSSLLMLVCAFAGFDRMMAAYKQAVEMQYRFFSYGDAMLIL